MTVACFSPCKTSGSYIQWWYRCPPQRFALQLCWYWIRVKDYHDMAVFSHVLFISCSCRWGENMSLNCGHQRACCLSPRWYISVDSHGGMILTGKVEELGEKPVPLCPTHATSLDPAKKPVTKRPSHGTARYSRINCHILGPLVHDGRIQFVSEK
jgi:hypothetical protein